MVTHIVKNKKSEPPIRTRVSDLYCLDTQSTKLPASSSLKGLECARTQGLLISTEKNY